MGTTAFYAPAHRVRHQAALGGSGFNPPPSIDCGGAAIQDPRLLYNLANSPTGAQIIGWYNSSFPKVVSQVPSTIATANIAALQNPTSGTALTLVSSTGAGITVVAAGGFVPWPNYTNLIPAGTLAIDGLPGIIRVGTHRITAFYNPALGISRCVSVTGVASGTGGPVTVRGYDWYGYAMSQTITLGAGVNTVNSTKAFKFITSVTPGFTDTHAISVGTADIFGLNIAADFFADVDIFWNNASQVAATFTAAVTTTATATTGDVRGTFTAGSASDGTKRLDMFVRPALARITQVPQATGLFGVAQA